MPRSIERSIIVAFIPNALGHAALAAGIEEAARRSAPLIVVHALAESTTASDAAVQEEELNAVDRALANSGIDHHVRLSDIGASAAEALVQIASETEAQLVVIGIRARSAVGKLLLGSNALEILNTSPCPVLCVRAEHIQRSQASEPSTSQTRQSGTSRI